MIKGLIVDFFNEIEKRELRKNKNAKANFWVEELQEADYNDKNYIGIKKATRVYDKYVEGKENVSVKAPNKFLCDEISRYLGYESFEDYKSKKGVLENDFSKGKENKKTRKNYKKIICVVSIITFIATVVLIKVNYSNATTCIIWQNTHFKKTTCDTHNALNNSTYNINIDIFSKIEVTTETEFFKNNKPVIWYGKNKNKEMEFFTARGIHPETLKELKPITETIINNYILKNKAEKTI